MRAQDAGTDRGVAYGVRFGGDFDRSYPETTGYIIPTFLRLGKRFDGGYISRAVEMGDWEIAVQMGCGSVMAGKYNSNPTPAVFNTGQVLLGWAALYQATGQQRFRDAARHAVDWLLSQQETDGNWIRGNSQDAANTSTVYNVKAAWGMCEMGAVCQWEDAIEAAIRNAQYALSRQRANGWFSDCCLSDPRHPLLHTIAYTMQGLLGIGGLVGRSDFVEAAALTADALIRLMDTDGFIPGRIDSDFRGAASWSCLTGTAQTSIVWAHLHGVTGQEKYREALRRANQYLMARHDIANNDPRIRGGVPGSWPVWGGYGRFQILNWATNFLAGALMLELELDSR